MNAVRYLSKGIVRNYTLKTSNVVLRAGFARVASGKKKGSKSTGLSVPPPAPAPLAVEDAWEPVTDKATGQIYYWNTVTNETTALGAPRPVGATALAPQQPQQQGGMLSGLGAVMAEGLAFGTGSAVAHNVVNSFFGGGGGDSGHDSGEVSDEFDI